MTIRRIPALLCCLLLSSLAMPAAVAGSQEFVLNDSIDRFYQPEIYHLPNGMRIILKPRPEVQKVSIRMVVALGLDHFSCEQSEMPHIIEHMLFEGTERYSNIELEQRVAEHGASWNAITDAMQTRYSFEVYGAYIEFAFDTLYAQLNSSLMDEAAMARSIESAQIESDNAGGMRQLWQLFDFGGDGSDRLFAEMGVNCPEAIDPYQFDHRQLLATFERYYVPANMTMVVVGDFEAARVRDYLHDSFGRMPAGEPAQPVRQMRWQTPPPGRYQSFGVLALRDTEGVGIVWQTAGYRGEEYLSLRVLGNYLNMHLYNLLRNEHQLSYAPAAHSYPLERRGVFYIEADTRQGNAERVLQLMRQELDRIRDSGLPRETFAQAKRSLLIGLAMSDLNNDDIADYYSESLFELADGAAFWNYERWLMSLDYETFKARLQQFFSAQQGVEYVDSSMFNTTRVIALAILFVLLLLLGIGLRFKRRRPWISTDLS